MREELSGALGEGVVPRDAKAETVGRISKLRKVDLDRIALTLGLGGGGTKKDLALRIFDSLFPDDSPGAEVSSDEDEPEVRVAEEGSLVEKLADVRENILGIVDSKLSGVVDAVNRLSDVVGSVESRLSAGGAWALSPQVRLEHLRAKLTQEASVKYPNRKPAREVDAPAFKKFTTLAREFYVAVGLAKEDPSDIGGTFQKFGAKLDECLLQALFGMDAEGSLGRFIKVPEAQDTEDILVTRADNINSAKKELKLKATAAALVSGNKRGSSGSFGPSGSTVASGGARSSSGRACWICNSSTHLARDCTSRRGGQETKGEAPVVKKAKKDS